MSDLIYTESDIIDPKYISIAYANTIKLVENKRIGEMVLSDATKAYLDKIIEEYQNIDKLKSYSARPSQKILFYGPTGCGKTMAASVIAKKLSLPLFSIQVGSLLSNKINRTIERITELFEYINSRETPGIILFEGFEYLAGNKAKFPINDLFKVMDSSFNLSEENNFSYNLMIATTTSDSDLNKAVWHRFDDTVYFDNPKQEQVIEMVERKLSLFDSTCSPNDKTLIASRLRGMSYADIEKVLDRTIKEKILNPAPCEDSYLEDFNKALNRSKFIV